MGKRKETSVSHLSADIMNERGGSLILPWPNTMANVRKTARELRAQGWTAKIEKTKHETYVWTNAPMGSRR